LELVDYHTTGDSRLQLSKRIDWRFLLPDPQLRRVAYVGNADSELVESLRLFCDTLTVLSPNSNAKYIAKKDENFDLIVLRSLQSETLETISSFLKPRGYLYWEINRSNFIKFLWKFGGKDATKNVVRISKAKSFLNVFSYQYILVYLKHLGFHHIQVHWHRPNFHKCVEIVPLNDAVSLNHIFSRSKTGIIAKLKLTTGRFFLKADLLPYILPCISIIACKKTAESMI
jgi:hypothetical protein